MFCYRSNIPNMKFILIPSLIIITSINYQMSLTIRVSGIIKRSQPRLNIRILTRCPIVDINSSGLPLLARIIISKFSIARITISCTSVKFKWDSCLLSFCSSNTLSALSALNTLNTLISYSIELQK